MPRLLLEEICFNGVESNSDYFIGIKYGDQFQKSQSFKKKTTSSDLKVNFTFYITKYSIPLTISFQEKKLLKKGNIFGEFSFENFFQNVNLEENEEVAFRIGEKITVKLKFKLTLKSCHHEVSEHNHNFEIVGKCCEQFFGCSACHEESVSKKQKGHELERISHLRCMRCLIKQPYSSKVCVCCGLQFGETYCQTCHQLFNDDRVHCYECGKCYLSSEAPGHTHFVFLAKESEIRKQMEKVNNFANDLNFGLYQLLFKTNKEIGMNMQLLNLFLEKELAKSSVLQIRTLMNVLKGFREKEEFAKYGDTLDNFVKELEDLKMKLEDVIKNNKNVKRREFYLMKCRILKKIKFIKFREIKKRREENRKAKEEEERMLREKGIFKWEVIELSENAEFEKFYKKFQEAQTAEDLLDTSYKKVVKKLISNKLSDDDDFLDRKSNVCFHFAVSKMFQLIYGNRKNLKYYHAHSQLETERKVIEEYKSICQLNKSDLHAHLLLFHAIMVNFCQSGEYIQYTRHWGEKLRIVAENVTDVDYTHIEALNVVINFSFRKISEHLVEIMQRKFFNLVMVLTILKELQASYYELVPIEDSRFFDFILSCVRKMDYCYFLRSEFEEEKKAQLETMPEVTKEITVTSYILHTCVEKMKDIEKKGIKVKFQELFKMDIIEVFASSIQDQIEKLITSLAKIVTDPQKQKEVDIELFRGLFPVCIDLLRKYVKGLKIDLLQVFKTAVDFAFMRLRSKLEGWTNKAIALDKYKDCVDAKSGLYLSYHCQSVVEIIMQPVDLVFEVDCLTRESESEEAKKTSYMNQYFEIIHDILHLYTSTIKMMMEGRISRIMNYDHLENSGEGFLDFMKALKKKNVGMRRIKNEDLLPIVQMCNNIHGCMTLAVDVFQNEEFEELLINTREKYEDVNEVPHLARAIRDLRACRNDTTKILAELLYIESYNIFSLIFDETKDFEKMSSSYCDFLNERFAFIVPRMYPQVSGKLLQILFTLIINEINDLVFTLCSNVKNIDKVEKIDKFVVKVSNLFHCDGRGLEKDFLSIEQKKTKELLKLFSKSPKDLRKLYKEKQMEMIGYYILKVLEIVGSKKDRKFVKKILPQESKKKSQMLSRILSFNKSKKLTLFVTLLSASNLLAKDLCGTSDPYVKMSCGKQKVKSNTIMKNLDPEWNEKFIFTCAEKDVLKLVCYDWDRLSSDDLIGGCEISISKLPKDKEVEKTYTLYDEKVVGGKIKLRFKLVKK